MASGRRCGDASGRRREPDERVYRVTEDPTGECQFEDAPQEASQRRIETRHPVTQYDRILRSSDVLEAMITMAKEESMSEQYRLISPRVNSLRFMTWNIDGLGDKAKMRTFVVCGTILREQPDIVHLQEVVPQALGFFDAILSDDYKVIIPDKKSYFTVTLLKKTTVLVEYHLENIFPNSTMGRSLLLVKAHMGGHTLTFINTHLESMTRSSKERIFQLKQGFGTCRNIKPSEHVILAGDMNLRDEEIDSMGGIPVEMEDLWIECGMPADCKYTWDLEINKNKQFPGKNQPRMRFDRVFQRPSNPPRFIPTKFRLIGTEKVANMFPSDHFGIVVDYTLRKGKS